MASVLATWSFDVDPAKLDEMVDRVKQVSKHLPSVPGWLGSDVFANEKRNRLMILSRWDSKDAWGRSVWDEQISQTLADFVDASRDQAFELYFHVASEPDGS